MKVRFNGISDVSLTNGKEYEVISIEKGWFRIVDNTEDDYLFAPDEFEITDSTGYYDLKQRDESGEWVKPKFEEKTA
ncbi:MAG: hypothetical protein IJT87_11615 [Ruminiclostridium sp.]|nr:hypothetical protein [Ruminiclostridium sp.]